MTTKSEIGWLLKEGLKRNEKVTHMLIVCDTFSYHDYPVYVTEDQDVREVYNKYHGKEMKRVMEVYDYSRPWADQLKEPRAFHL